MAFFAFFGLLRAFRAAALHHELFCAVGWLRQHLHARLVAVITLLAARASGGGAARPAKLGGGHDQHIGLRRGRAPSAVHLHPPPLVTVEPEARAAEALVKP